MSDDGYDSMDAERDRAYRLARPEEFPLESYPTASLFDPEEEPEEPPCADDPEYVEQHEITWVMSADSAHPVEGLCSCGERIEVARP